MYARPNVTPIGWSESGHFAVIVDRNLEGIGGTRHEYKIINAVTDQIVFEQAVDITAESLEQEDDPNAAKVKAEHQFAAARDQFGIQQGAGTDFHKLPVSVNDRRYSVDVRTTPQPDTEEWTPMDEIGSFEATVTAEGLGSKRITGSDDVRAYQVWPAGCFLSPFEPRMLVAIALEQYMFEGTEPAYVFSGAHLGVGYD